MNYHSINHHSLDEQIAALVYDDYIILNTIGLLALFQLSLFQDILQIGWRNGNRRRNGNKRRRFARLGIVLPSK